MSSLCTNANIMNAQIPTKSPKHPSHLAVPDLCWFEFSVFHGMPWQFHPHPPRGVVPHCTVTATVASPSDYFASGFSCFLMVLIVFSMVVLALPRGFSIQWVLLEFSALWCFSWGFLSLVDTDNEANFGGSNQSKKSVWRWQSQLTVLVKGCAQSVLLTMWFHHDFLSMSIYFRQLKKVGRLFLCSGDTSLGITGTSEISPITASQP